LDAFEIEGLEKGYHEFNWWGVAEGFRHLLGLVVISIGVRANETTECIGVHEVARIGFFQLFWRKAIMARNALNECVMAPGRGSQAQNTDEVLAAHEWPEAFGVQDPRRRDVGATGGRGCVRGVVCGHGTYYAGRGAFNFSVKEPS